MPNDNTKPYSIQVGGAVSLSYNTSMFKSQTVRRITSNTIYQLIGKLISLSITVLATVIITRTYGREGYGAFSLMQSYPALLFIIADFGLNAVAVRELSQNWQKAASYFANILILRVFISLALMGFMGVTILLLPYSTHLKLGIYLGLFLIITQAFYATTNMIFQVKLRYDYSVLGYTFGYLFILLAILVLSVLKIGVMWLNFSYVLGGFITFFINLSFIKKLGVPITFTPDKVLMRELFKESLPLGLMFVFSQINFKADSIALSILKVPLKYGLNNTESVAVYNLPYKVFEVSLVVPTFFMNSVYPVLVRHMVLGKEKLKSTFFNTLGALFGGGIVFTALGILFAPLMIRFLGGAEFAQSILVLRILFFGMVVFYLTQPISWLIVTLGKQRFLPWIYLISAILDVGANIIFIPKYSFYGSSVITIVSEVVVLILLVIFARKAWRLKYAS